MIESDLLNQLRRLKAASPNEASPRVEQQLLAAFRQRRPRKKIWWPYVLAAAALFIIGLFLLRPAHSPSPVPSFESADFIPLPYAQSGVPLEQFVVVRVRVKATQLTSIGVPVAASNSNFVNADLLVGQDGVPRAFRLIY